MTPVNSDEVVIESRQQKRSYTGVFALVDDIKGSEDYRPSISIFGALFTPVILLFHAGNFAKKSKFYSQTLIIMTYLAGVNHFHGGSESLP